MQLIIHTLQNPSLPGFSRVLPHEFNSLLHTCAELGARLPVWILILVNHEIFRPISRVVDLFETPRTNPSWIFHNKWHMILDVPPAEFFFPTLLWRDTCVDDDLGGFVDLGLSVCA